VLGRKGVPVVFAWIDEKNFPRLKRLPCGRDSEGRRRQEERGDGIHIGSRKVTISFNSITKEAS